MENPVKSEGNAVSDLEHMIRGSDDELIFSDWQFVDRSAEQASDDDSIEIIEREILASLPSLPNSDVEESENEENDKDISNGINTTNDHIQTIVPLQQCHSCAQPVNKANQVTNVTNGVTWKVLYSFMLGVLASLIFHHYKDCIPGKWSNFSVDKLSTPATLLFPFIRTNSLTEDYTTFGFSNVRENNDVLIRLRKYIQNQKTIVNSKFVDQLDLLDHVRQLRSDVYVFNISKLKQQTLFSFTEGEEISTLLRVDKEIPPCEDNITNEQLPLVCEDNQTFLVFVKEDEIIRVYDVIREIFSDTEKRLNKLHKSVLNLLTKPIHYDERSFSERHTNNFVPDCDHFGKEYKSNTYCMKKDSRCDDSSESDITSGSQETVSVNCKLDEESVHSIERKFSWNKFMGRTKPNEETRSQDEHYERSANDLEIQSVNYKKNCRKCGIVENFVEQSERIESGIVSDKENSSSAGKLAENKPAMEENYKKSISGDWLFKLNEARAKMRVYYKNMVRGDWILKLGKAREKLRKNIFQDEKEEKHKKSWYKKISEKFEHEIKTYVVEWKHQLKTMKEDIVNKFKNLKLKFKNKLRK